MTRFVRDSGIGVATVSRIDEMIGLFCRMQSLLKGSFAKETYNVIDPTDRSHPIQIKTKEGHGVEHPPPQSFKCGLCLVNNEIHRVHSFMDSAVCCSVLQCVAVCCSMLQYVAV